MIKEINKRVHMSHKPIFLDHLIKDLKCLDFNSDSVTVSSTLFKQGGVALHTNELLCFPNQLLQPKRTLITLLGIATVFQKLKSHNSI